MTLDIIKLREEFDMLWGNTAQLDKRIKVKPHTEKKGRPGINEARFSEMKKLRYEDGETYQQIANRFGISRERVRQILGNTGWSTRTKALKKKLEGITIKNLSVSEISDLTGLPKTFIRKNVPSPRFAISGDSYRAKGYAGELAISRLLTENGIENVLMPNSHPFDIMLKGGARVDVKFSYSITRSPSFKFNTENLHRFAIRKRERGEYADFFILAFPEMNDIFIVPSCACPKDNIALNWPAPGKRISKYAKYLNAFHLLKTDS